jgi:hypothetical protein
MAKKREDILISPLYADHPNTMHVGGPKSPHPDVPDPLGYLKPGGAMPFGTEHGKDWDKEEG